MLTRKTIATFSALALILSGLVSVSTPATAGTNVNVFYNGNTIGTGVPASITVDRDLVPLPAAASVTGSRTGYSFGGWSISVGGAPLTGSTYTFSSTAERLDLHAVWNTTVSYNLNGAESGTLSVARTNDAYRFGQTLTLPTAGTLSKAGFAFGGWMTSSVSTNRFTSYTAGTNDLGNPTLYAAWIKTVSFNANGATVGSIPAAQVYVDGGARLKLPVASEMTLRKPGYEFLGWSTNATGSLVSNPTSYVPVVSQRTLFAIWKIQTTKASLRVFFNPDKSTLRSAQKLAIRELVDSLAGRTAIEISLAATRAPGDVKSLGKSRNTAVVDYLRSLGVEATFTRTSTIGKSSVSTSPKNNRVTISASWTNPTN
jgi:outer membrane protein OmpA-like peptidoglycan-associated protein